VDEEDVVHVYTIPPFLKRWNSIICNNMEGTGDHYAKWNKPGTERQVAHDYNPIVESSNLVSKKWRVGVIARNWWGKGGK
jgi:hypothetical protein